MAQEEVRAHTAAHVLKGAAQRVIAARKTASTSVEERHGWLSFQLDRKPTAEELRLVEEAANREIAKGVDVTEFEMERQEAELQFGDGIYDTSPGPSASALLRIVRIPEWTTGCCSERHVDNTSLIGPLKLGKARFRNSKKELELEFELADLMSYR
jgi:alanyl-tRNA synthetase